MVGSFAFIGNRRFVLESMIQRGVIPGAVYVVAGSHLERDLEVGRVSEVKDYISVRSKTELMRMLEGASFDYLISNGCPYILPINDLPQARYVNIHPSFLPDLRGIDPVVGAILHKRDGGATCHLMDAGIDSGPIISQVRIPFTEDLDVSTMYQLSFEAEKQVFVLAFESGFNPSEEQQDNPHSIYYSRSSGDQHLTFREQNDTLIQKVRAFSNRSQGCTFETGGHSFRVFRAERMQNSFMANMMHNFSECVVGMSYESSIVFRKDGEILRLSGIVSGENVEIPIGTNLLLP
jgi:methionyl-tRNA formyltransferase